MYVNQRLFVYRENVGELDFWSSLFYEIFYGDCFVRYYRELDIYILIFEFELYYEFLVFADSCIGYIFKFMNI